MLKGIINQGLTSYHESFDNWQDAVRASYRGMVEQGIVDEAFIDEVIESIVEFGPYVVIAPYVAMPHTTVGSKHAHGTAFSFMKVNQPVIFDENDESKNAKLFFSFAAQEENAHLKNIVALVELLLDDEFVGELFNVNNDDELQAVLEKYNK